MPKGDSEGKRVITDINQLMSHRQIKNDFIVSLRNHLMEKYNTRAHYTYDNEYKRKREEGENSVNYSLVRKDPTEPREIHGFCFRKDLCDGFLSLFQTEEDLIKDIVEYAEEQGIEAEIRESLIEDQPSSIDLIIDDEKYWGRVYIEDGYAGEIDFYISEHPAEHAREVAEDVFSK